MTPKSRPVVLSRSISAALAALTVTAIVTTFCPSEARAVSLYWDTNSTTTGSGAATGTWGTSNFWSDSSTGAGSNFTTTTSSGDDLFFSAGTNGTTGTVTISGSQSAHKLTFDDGVALTLSGGTAINLGSATAGSGIFVTANAANTINTAIAFDPAAADITFSTTSTGILTIGGNLSGAAPLIKAGTGQVTLSGTNTNSGTTTINAGNLLFAKRVSFYNADTSKWSPSFVTVNSGGTVSFAVGGTGEFTLSEFNDLFTSLSLGGLKAGSSFGISNAGAVTLLNALTNSGGTGGGSIGFAKQGGGTLTMSAANSYTGTTVAAGGTVNVQNDQSAATGGWLISDSGVAASSVNVNFQTGSTVVVASGKSVSLSTGNSGGQIMTLNVAGNVTNSGTLSVGRQSALNMNSGGFWTQNGTMSIATSSLTFGSASMTVNAGSTFIYGGSSAITFSPSGGTSPGGTGNANLTLAGGTFVTGKGFSNTVAASQGAANFVMSGGGTLGLTATVPTLITTSGSTVNFRVGTGGGIIDTAGFNTAITQVVADVSGQTGSLTKQGAGTLTLSNGGTYTGDTTVTGGVLALNGALSGTTAVNVSGGGKVQLGIADVLNNAATLNLTGGTFDTGGLNETIGALSLGLGLSTIDLGTNASAFHLADSSAATWNGTLSILNWSGNQAGGGLDQLFFGNSDAGLTALQIDAIQFIDPAGLPSGTYDAQLLPTGELVAVPEPSSFAAIAGGLACLLGARRRRNGQSV